MLVRLPSDISQCHCSQHLGLSISARDGFFEHLHCGFPYSQALSLFGSPGDEPFGFVDLWWRDGYNQTRTSPNGRMFYWSRGNGWVIAAHVRTLQYLPDTDPHYAEYLQTLQEMAASLKDRQQPDGFDDRCRPPGRPTTDS